MRTKLARISELSKERPDMVFTSIGHLIDEDKLVQEAVRRLLEAVFEPHFYDEMMGFIPKRRCHDAIKKLNVMLEKRKTGWVKKL